MQSARLSKLNLIYGPNSGGKSSIIQALLLLKQSRTDDYETRYLDAEPTGKLMPRGEYVDLGSFSALIHKHDQDRTLGIALSYDGHGYAAHRKLPAGLIKAEMTFAPAQSDNPTSIESLTYQLHHDGQPLFDGKWSGGAGIDRKTPSKHLSIAGIDVATDLIAITRFGFLPYLYVPGLTPEAAVDWKEASSKPEVVELVRQLEENLAPQAVTLLRSLDSRRSYDNVLDSIIYLGPLRSYPERIYSVSGRNRLSTGVRGEFTPDVLYTNPELVTRVNSWFERFLIPYELAVSKSGDVALTGEYMSVTLIDKNSGTTVTLADVGFGINQLLPVIVEGVTTWTPSIFDPDNRIICLEQPEIHLHPRLQAQVADLMIETSRGRAGKQWIVETHSELLVRRIQRRIEEGVLQPSDVCLIYVDPQEHGGSEMIMLRLDENGDFIDDWPSGFFEESYNEVMGY